MSLAREDPDTGMLAVVTGYYRRARRKSWSKIVLTLNP